jgi:hypothetical protein
MPLESVQFFARHAQMRFDIHTAAPSPTTVGRNGYDVLEISPGKRRGD